MRKILPAFILLSFVSSSVPAQKAATPSFALADSLFTAGEWKPATLVYKKVLADTSKNSLEWNRLGFSYFNLKEYDQALSSYEQALHHNPRPALKALIYSRVAKVHAMRQDKQQTLQALKLAIDNGFTNVADLDTSAAYNGYKNDPVFAMLRDTTYNRIFPCATDPQARAFDFWIGDWNVYITGTKSLVGFSHIEKISGECSIYESWKNLGSGNGKSMNFIDPLTNKWRQVWVGSDNSRQDYVDGAYIDGAMRFTFENIDAQGVKSIGRFIFYNKSPNEVRQFQESSTDNGNTWVTTYDFTYIRK
jgi:tetratricopeptide (TPR) repeat protein